MAPALGFTHTVIHMDTVYNLCWCVRSVVVFSKISNKHPTDTVFTNTVKLLVNNKNMFSLTISYILVYGHC